jgi:hypothetical protein
VLTQVLHHQTRMLHSIGRDKQLNMIGHQTEGMDTTPISPSMLSQILQIETVIRLRAETGRPLITSLNDVQGDAWNGQVRAPMHLDLLVQCIPTVKTFNT